MNQACINQLKTIASVVLVLSSSLYGQKPAAKPTVAAVVNNADDDFLDLEFPIKQAVFTSAGGFTIIASTQIDGITLSFEFVSNGDVEYEIHSTGVESDNFIQWLDRKYNTHLKPKKFCSVPTLVGQV